jgi:hypothetical protein
MLACNDSQPLGGGSASASPATTSSSAPSVTMAPSASTTAPAQSAGPAGPTDYFFTDVHRLRVRFTPPAGWTVTSDSFVQAESSVESTLEIGVGCLGEDCAKLDKSAIMTEGRRRYDHLSRTGLTVRWLQQPKEDVPNVFSSSFMVEDAPRVPGQGPGVVKEEVRHASIDRLLKDPPVVLHCALEVRAPDFAVFDALVELCRNLEYEVLAAPPKP